jgi:hypothetical protein
MRMAKLVEHAHGFYQVVACGRGTAGSVLGVAETGRVCRLRNSCCAIADRGRWRCDDIDYSLPLPDPQDLASIPDQPRRSGSLVRASGVPVEEALLVGDLLDGIEPGEVFSQP